MADNLLLPLSIDRLVDADGVPLGGAKVYVYDAGTTNLKDVFTDNGLGVAAANPVIADAGGYIEPRFIGTGDYKLVITDADDVTIKTADSLTGALDTSGFANDEATPVTPVIAKSANYTVQSTDKGKVILADSTGGNVTITLLSASEAGDDFRITVKHVGSANSVTVDTTGGDELDGSSSLSLDTQYEAVTCVSDGADWHVSEDAQVVPASVPPGVVSAYAGSSAPSGWLLCDGTDVSRTTYADLFAAIGTTYGNGNGTTTFDLPDLTGRVVAGKESSATRLTSAGGGVDGGTLGATGGDETHTLTTAELASHTHSGTTDGHTHGMSDHFGNFEDGQPGGSGTTYIISDSGHGDDTDSATDDFTTDATGSGDGHANVQPTIILNYIIKT